MGGPERQTTPRTGLDDFVAGLLKYGTLGYLPPDVLNQLFPPTPGTPGTGGGPHPTFDLKSLLTGGGPFIGPTVPGMSTTVPSDIGGGNNWNYNPGGNGLPGGGGQPGGGLPFDPGSLPPGTGNAPPAGSVPFDIGKFIQGRLSIPQYGGPFTAPVNALQSGALGGASSALSAFFAPRSNTTGPLFASPPIGGGGGGLNGGIPNVTTGAGIGTGNDIISQLLNRGTQTGQTPERSLLDVLGIQGPQANLNAAFQALDAQRRTGLAQDVNNLREQFSFTGNRFGSDLANAIGQRQSASEQNYLANVAPLAAQLAPQLFGQQVSALGTAGQLGGEAGNQSLQALLGLPGAFSTTSMLPGQVAGQGFNLGEQLRQIMQGDTSARQAEFTRTQGGLFPTLLQYAAGAPQIYTPGIGQQAIGAGAAALGAK